MSSQTSRPSGRPATDASSIVEVLQNRASESPDRTAYIFLADGEFETSRISFSELDTLARAIGSRLQQSGCSGETALLLFPPGVDFIAGFLGCLYAGVVAVPAYPPRKNRGLNRLASIMVDAQPKAVLTTSPLRPLVQAWAGEDARAGSVEIIAADSISRESASDWRSEIHDRDRLAFLQYTSGSTAAPKGVMVTHGNIIANEELIRTGFEQTESSVIVSWLPMYHDMGLIGGVLQPLYAGATCVFMPPLAFLQRPRRWLEAITRYRATTSGGPNFAYDLCVRRASGDYLMGLDLSTWRVAFNGAEPVRAETMERFAEAFAPCGFTRNAFYPCYGLAEATLFVTGGQVSEEPRSDYFSPEELKKNQIATTSPQEGRRLVSCGYPRGDQEVLIIEAATCNPVPAGRIGEIWITGPSVARGYWNRPEETERDFGARLRGVGEEEGEKRYLRTGDLGFLHRGELFITGRLKDLIIVRGRNYYPQDIELTVESSHRALRPGCGAVFSVEGEGGERVVAVHEVDSRFKELDPPAVIETIRGAVAREHEILLHDVVLISQGSIHKTSSGKIRRQACRSSYVRGGLTVVAARPLGDDAEGGYPSADLVVGGPRASRDALLQLEAGERHRLVKAFFGEQVARILRSSIDIDSDRPLVSMGLDSLAAVELKHVAEERFGVELSLGSLLDEATLTQTVDVVLRRLEKASADPETFPFSIDASSQYPLSHGQRGLWFLQRVAPDSAAYSLPVAVKITGPLDVARFECCLQAIVNRHSALRTTFHQTADGEPVQRVHEAMKADLTCEEASNWDEARITLKLCEEAWRPFDLERGPLFKVAVFRRAADEYWLLIVVHHIVADFWSLVVLFTELSRLYQSWTGFDAVEDSIAPLMSSYSDFVAWSRDRLAGPEGERSWQYWRETLSPLPAVIDLPTDRPRPPIQGFRGAATALSLSPELTESVQRISRSSDASLFVVLLAAFKVLLYRYTGQSDVTVGCPVAGRSLSRFGSLIGYFVNPVVLRTNASDLSTFREYVECVRRSTLGAIEHQDYPFSLLAERLNVARDPSRTPLFQVMFALQKAPARGPDGISGFALGETGAEMRLGPLSVRSLSLPERQVGFDLTLMMADTSSGLGASLQYNRDLFDDESASRMLGHLRCLLSSAVADPHRTIQRLELLTPEERELLLVEWNSTDVDHDRGRLLHELFEAQAGRSPGAIAVESEREFLTYGELEQRANRLARMLRRMGVAPESVVGIYLDRSVDLVVAILGTLKAGGAYVPLDPSHPSERLRLILEDSRLSILLTSEDLRSRLPNCSARVVDMVSKWGEIRRERAERVPRSGSPEQPAYLLFTSGSTGRPKGVAVPHRAIVNFLESVAREPGLRAEDVFVSVTTPSFDIFGLELYLPLMTGARLIMPSPETTADGARLLETLRRTQATAMQGTPSTWRLLLAAGWDGQTSFRLLCGGEALPWDLARELRARAASVWNLYGPTETTIWSSLYELDDERETGVAPIGRPIANTRLYVADRRYQLTPTGVPGELFIAGAGLARGYWRLPALTAENFLPDPFSSGYGARMYRTGDLSRWRADATVEFLGRLDYQAKVRGFRLELGEVERVLASHPGVGEAVAVVRDNGSGAQRLIGYVVPADRETELDPSTLRGFMLERLPEPFVPSLFVVLQSLPQTPNGKVDRKALPEPEVNRTAAGRVELRSDLERAIAEIWRAVLKVDKLGRDDNFFDLGGHSLLLAQVQKRLSDAGHEISMVNLFRHPTVGAVADHLAQEEGEGEAKTISVQEGSRRGFARRRSSEREDIAIIGMAGRFPGARNIDEFWSRLASGDECISVFSDDELADLHLSPDVLNDPRYVKAGGMLEGADLFDAAFFGFHPREAEMMDPQHRIFLQCAWQALEDAGYNSGIFPGRIGVFAGAGLNTYLHDAAPDLSESSALRYQAFIGNDKDFLATRVSYKMNLKGPSLNVQTACSTSLVAVHVACQSLLAGECDMALAGGVGIRTPLKQGYLYEEGGILSPDGHCRAFDKDARGTVFGSGAGVVILKPLNAALADGDHIYALIKGSAINNDGGVKIGYTAPGLDGQAEVIAEALSVGGVEPETVSYVEAHGTGTALGDPIEIAALTEVFRSQTSKKQFCAIGSVKTNIGHLDTAAGIAGLVKTVCALQRQMLPPSLHFKEANPKIDFDNGPFYVNTRLSEWRTNGAPRRAGVSSFGIGGTNVHVVLEEPPTIEPGSSGRPWQLITLSAKTASALDRVMSDLARELKDAPATDVGDVAYTMQVGRRTFAHRGAVVCRDLGEAAEFLESGADHVLRGIHEEGNPSVAFLFPGQGTQYVDMARQLHQAEKAFAAEVDACLETLRSHLDTDLRWILFPPETGDGSAAERLEETVFAQPALFVIEYALARLLMKWGVKPVAMMGHSIGEYVAACLSGVLSIEDALRLVAFRGRLMQSMPRGAMVAVQLGPDGLEPLMTESLSLAALNGPSTSVVSGSVDATAAFERRLAEQGIPFTHLHTSHAFHSSMMDPIVEKLVAEAGRCRLRTPAIPYISNLTGSWITPAQAVDPGYWGRHLRETVRFGDGVKALREDHQRILLEVGPGRSLSTLVRQQDRSAVVISSLPHVKDERSDVASVLGAVGRLWVAGMEIDWKGFYAGERRLRVPLPAYPFEEQRHWVKAKQGPSRTGAETQSGIRFYAPVWRRSILPRKDDVDESRQWLVLGNGESLAAGLAARLRSNGFDVTSVQQGSDFRQSNQSCYTVDPGRPEHYDRLAKELVESGRFPDTVVHAWNAGSAERGNGASWDELRCLSFDSLLFLARALESANPEAPVRIGVLSTNMQKVCGERQVCPEKSLLLGPVRVVPQEYPNLSCQSIDVTFPEPASSDEDELISNLLDELTAPPLDRLVAYRGGERWVQDIDQLQPEFEARVRPRLREGGVYLITGGFGGIGMTFAEEIARAVKAKLILLSRSVLPDRHLWREWLAAHPESDRWTRVIRGIELLEELGSVVLTVPADVSDAEAVESAVRWAEIEHGPINGVIHAAGAPGGGIIQLKTPDSIDRVLAAKVRGALALKAALRWDELDFFMLCSSVTSLVGGFGQSDYCAANAFCDSFAQSSFRHRGAYVVSINWDRWEGVGMASDTAGTARSLYPAAASGAATVPASDGAHPLLGVCISRGAERAVFVSQLSPVTHWILSEHKVSGVPTVPGTAYLEMARAAFMQLQSAETVEIRDVTFRTPMMVEEGEAREVVTLMEQIDHGYSFRVLSRPAASVDGSQVWLEHSRGEIEAGRAPEDSKSGRSRDDVLEMRQKVLRNWNGGPSDNGSVSGRAKAANFITTGPRWESLKGVRVEDEDALAVIDIDETLADDLAVYVLHPSLLDIATGFVQFLVDGDYLPLVYERLVVQAPIPGRALSHARLRHGGRAAGEVITCDVSIFGEDGSEAVRIEGFSMKRVARGSLLSGDEAGRDVLMGGERHRPLSGVVGDGISRRQGAEAFRRVLAGGIVPQIAVLAGDFRDLAEAAQSMNRSRLLEELRGVGSGEIAHARPPVSTLYAAPSSEIERRIAVVWQRVLGIEQVGINDSFFELGGTSLTGIQLVSELRKEFDVEVPVVSIFEASTVSALARYLSSQSNDAAVFEQVQDRAEKKRKAFESRRRAR